ncbi:MULTISPECIES: enoyl-CoA hydratase [unclassified Sphingobium]|uniref:enoyl-CoA hydratase n=1 Tax=unclassified Sphingobium TaxID=2611147 RepID=UPI000D1617FC|nr:MULTISPECIES: enoyl-CoA hydratase [unclassified Sphingobium]MBG6120132.1 2-(1,2-epoxy-1,2-dihydrophenyl)acetyl-CoA isomerase [Sphingobium sp. JAI105]PSO12827.1 enoyl-CoA hydratase [Sphingobium sp. AEW4]TWD05667.1 enoyl-CoA hydratase [Sphingobium sp. AEW010]TWD23220.1 enoyl-CoA hydratase [Sphingobium sp. AEW013]TWD25080.1 enoyl-CoA hydratase [Sphingobium sp. AEW001]
MSELLESRDGSLVTLTLNRPDAMNAVSDAMIRALLEAFERLGQDGDVGAILLTGAGRGFCAGGDVKGMANRKDRNYEERVQDLLWKQRIALAIRSCPKVVVAGVNGAAMGAGLSLALAADFRVVARSAKLGTAFAAVAYSGDFGCSYFLTQLVGPAKARELMILNPRLTAEEADKLGLVTKIVEDEGFLDEATAFARTIADGPRVTWGYMKRNLFAAETRSLAEVLEIEALSQSRCAMTQDHKEARTAWAEKRKPVFSGS